MSDWVDDPKNDEWVDDAPSGNKHSALASGLMHGLQGMTGNFMDELQGAGEVAGRMVGVEGAGGPMKDMGFAKDGPTLKIDVLKQAYLNARNRERKALDEQAKEHPIASGLGELGGMLVSPINEIGNGLSLAKSGAAIGGINALGTSDAEDLTGMAKDTAFGVGLGGALGKGVEKAGPYLERGAEKVSGGLRSLAEKFMARGLGAERGTIKSIGIDKVKNAAGQMLDHGEVGMLSNTDDLIAKNTALKNKGGKMMGQAYDAIDDAGASTFHPHEVAEKVDDELGGFWRSALNKGETNQFDNTIESILERGSGDIPLSEAQALKEELQAAANWKNTLSPTAKEQMARDAYRIVSDKIDEAVKIGGNAVDKAGLSETLKSGKDMYSKASTAEKLLQNKQAREQGNSIIGLTDAITGAGALGYGGTTGDWKTAGGVMLAKKGLQKYGAQNAALALNKVSKMLIKSPRFAQMAEKSPQAFNAMALNFAKKLGGGLEQMPKSAGGDNQKDIVSEDEAQQKFLDGN